MPRPKKDEHAQPTRDRILHTAIDLFSRNGYAGTSIRDITKALSLNEASLYNHFPNKQAILDAIVELFRNGMPLPKIIYQEKGDTMLSAASPVPTVCLVGESDIDYGLAKQECSVSEQVVEQILQGAAVFFSRANEQMMKIWRILLIEQYGNSIAEHTVRSNILDAPRHYFRELLGRLYMQGRLPNSSWLDAAADSLAALFFEFSFVSNLDAAWNTTDTASRKRLLGGVNFIVESLFAVNVESPALQENPTY